MHHPRSFVLLLPITAVLGAAVIGCSHTLQVDVPHNYTGPVTITCTQWASGIHSIQVDRTGTALHAVCPPSRATLVVVRDGQPIQPVTEPRWSVTGDTIVLGLQFDVR